MTSDLQVICPGCQTLHPFGYAYCHNCGASLDHARVVQQLAGYPSKTEEPPGFFAWWFKPSVTLIFRWPLIVAYPILSLVALAWIASLIVSAFPYAPLEIGIGVLLTFPLLLGPSYSFIMALIQIHGIWTDPSPKGNVARILRSVAFLFLPFIAYTVIIFLLSIALGALTGLVYQP